MSSHTYSYTQSPGYREYNVLLAHITSKHQLIAEFIKCARRLCLAVSLTYTHSLFNSSCDSSAQGEFPPMSPGTGDCLSRAYVSDTTRGLFATPRREGLYDSRSSLVLSPLGKKVTTIGLQARLCYSHALNCFLPNWEGRPPLRLFSWIRNSVSFTRSRNYAGRVVIPTRSHALTLTLAFTHSPQVGLPHCWSTSRQQLL